MRAKLIGFGIFGIAINAFLYFRGGWMPVLLISSVVSLLAGLFVRDDTTS